MDGDVRMITLVGVEWRDSGSSVRSVVVSELCKRKQVGPIVLLVVAIYADVLLQGLVSALGLSVAFGVVAGGEVKSHVECFSEGAEEVGYELRATVGGDVRRNSVLREDVEDEELC